jgi:hypothetical protein
MERGSISHENLQMIYQWKALGEENVLEQFISIMVHYASLAWEMKLARPKHGESDPTLENFN